MPGLGTPHCAVCPTQAFRVEGLGGTGQGGRVYPGPDVGLAGGRGVRTEGLCGPAIGELLAWTWTQRHVLSPALQCPRQRRTSKCGRDPSVLRAPEDAGQCGQEGP